MFIFFVPITQQEEGHQFIFNECQGLQKSGLGYNNSLLVTGSQIPRIATLTSRVKVSSSCSLTRHGGSF